MKFTKMQAFGNDYVYIDAIHQKLNNLPELARFVSDRHFAIGSDGMVLICPSDKGDFRMRMFNPDGSEGEMCGNALRSVGKYVYDHRLTDQTDLVIETLGGMQHLNLTVKDGLVSNIRADIGEPRLDTKVLSLFSLKKNGILKALFNLSIITVVISLLPLMYGLNYYTLVGAFITVTLVIESILAKIQ